MLNYRNKGKVRLMIDHNTVSIIFNTCIALITILVILSIVHSISLFTKKRSFKFRGLKGVFLLSISVFVLGSIFYCLYHLPEIFMFGIPWAMIDEMGPTGLISAVFATGLLSLILIMYINLRFFLRKKLQSNNL
jgi:hypothetical protein